MHAPVGQQQRGRVIGAQLVLRRPEGPLPGGGVVELDVAVDRRVTGAPVAVQDPVAAADRDHRAVGQLHRVVVRAAVVQRRGGRPAGARVRLVEGLHAGQRGGACRCRAARPGRRRRSARRGSSRSVPPGSSAPVPQVWRVGFGSVLPRERSDAVQREEPAVARLRARRPARARSASGRCAGRGRPTGDGRCWPRTLSSVTKSKFGVVALDLRVDVRLALLVEPVEHHGAPVGEQHLGRVPAPVAHVGLAAPGLGDRVEREDRVQALAAADRAAHHEHRAVVEERLSRAEDVGRLVLAARRSAAGRRPWSSW